jgi:predicted nicotinamide N-methyase
MQAGDLITETLPLPTGELRLLQPRDGAELPDNHNVEWGPVVPYWSVLWRSGIALARELGRQKHFTAS